jgi:hypothetical protein
MTDAPGEPNPYAAPKADIAAGAPRRRSSAGPRVTAGILLILAAVMNLGAAFVYAAGGVVGSGAFQLRNALEDRARNEGRPPTPAEKARIDAVDRKVESSATGFLVFAGFLALTVVTSIVAAVSLFQGKRGRFVLVAGLLALAAEVVSLVISRFGPANVFGAVVALVAIVAGMSMTTGAARPA